MPIDPTTGQEVIKTIPAQALSPTPTVQTQVKDSVSQIGFKPTDEFASTYNSLDDTWKKWYQDIVRTQAGQWLSRLAANQAAATKYQQQTKNIADSFGKLVDTSLSQVNQQTTPKTEMPSPTTVPVTTPKLDEYSQLDITKPQVIGWYTIDPNSSNPVAAENARIAIETENKNRAAAVKAKQDAAASAVKTQEKYAKEKDNYLNFDDVNNTFNNVENAKIDLVKSTGSAAITDQQAQEIANKYGVSPESVKNTDYIWDNLQLSEKGKQAKGITAHEQIMSDAALQHQRQLEDAKTNLQITEQNIDNNIADVQKQLDRNLSFMQASGAWSGSLRSSWYLSGIENVRQDGQTTINRLKTMLEQVRSADAKNVARLTEDYNTAVSRAKTDFDTQLNDLKHNIGASMNVLATQYGTWTEEFGNALKQIRETYWENSWKIAAQYIANMTAIKNLTDSNAEEVRKQSEYNDKIANKRFNEYVSNPELLWSTSFAHISDEVRNGTIPYEKANDLKAVITNSVISSLRKMGSGQVSSEDITRITNMLNQWSTAQEVISSLADLPKFKKVKTIEKSIDLGDKVRVEYSDGTYEDIAKSAKPTTEKPIVVWKESMIYDPETKKFIKTPGSEAVGVSYNLNPSDIADYSITKRWRENLQCGELVNDYWNMKTGSNAWVGDSLKSKVDAIKNIGYSETPVVWWLFVSNPLNNQVWHTGIVQKVNEDGSVVVLEANAKGLAKWSKPIEKTYSQDQVSGMVFSNAPKEVEQEKMNEQQKNNDLQSQVLGLTIWLGGTEWERKNIQDKIVETAQRNNISLADAKKKLGLKTWDDLEFAKTRKTDIQTLRKETRDKLSNANTALTMLNQPQTAIGDVASMVWFLKTIDPSSVARESEVASVENARWVLDSLSNAFQKAKEGTKMTEWQREQLRDAIQTIVNAGNHKYNDYIRNTVQEFNDRWLDPTVYISKSDIAKANEKVYTTDQWEYTEAEIQKEVTDALKSGTKLESIKKWLDKNGIPYEGSSNINQYR